MNRITLDLVALQHNLQAINRMMERQKASWSVVTKSLCGHEPTLQALHALGVRSVADSRLDNLRVIQEVAPDLETWYLRLPNLSLVPDIVALADVSLNTELEVISVLNNEARRRDCVHHVVIMIELGDLREGILPGSLVQFYQRVFQLPNIEVQGIGAQLGCLAGAIPNVDQMASLLLYRELLELKFSCKLPMVSAGSSIFLPLLQQQGGVPRGVNHYRIGEALFLGTDLVNGGTIAGLRDDVVCLEAEIAEIKEKSLVPSGETGGLTPFESLDPAGAAPPSPGQRGFRALVTVGQIDTDVAGLAPLDPRHQIAGASSDLTVVNIGEDPGELRIGDTIKFRTSYAAFSRAMNNPYMAKVVTPPLEEFVQGLDGKRQTDVPPTLSLSQTA